MQQEGVHQIIRAHSGIVKGVHFSPKERYIFCSGGTDGMVNVYNARQGQNTMSTRITTPNGMKNINAVRFNADGSRILSTTARRLTVLDAERGDLVISYENCTYSGRERAPLAPDPRNPHLVICGCTNGKGLITFDLRKQQPAHFALNVHSSQIRDIICLDGSWPFGNINQTTVVSLGLDGICKIRTIDDRELVAFDVKHRSNCVTATPSVYSYSDEEGFESIMMIGGDSLTSYYPGSSDKGDRLFTFGPSDRTINKLKFTSNGHMLYATAFGGQVRRYRRRGKIPQFLGEVYSHNDEILDMDISPNDEYLVTASSDGCIGLLCLGTPSYGWTGFMQLA